MNLLGDMGIDLFALLFAISLGIVCPTSGNVVKRNAGDELIFAHTVCKKINSYTVDFVKILKFVADLSTWRP